MLDAIDTPLTAEERVVALDRHFPRYEPTHADAPIWRVTANLQPCIHRFFDTSPISPSGRYLAVTRLPYEDRLPVPGDAAEVWLIDLITGERSKVADTAAWDTQLGAQVQWGGSDRQLFFNQIAIEEDWAVRALEFDVTTRDYRRLPGSVYMSSPDGQRLVSPCLKRIGATQVGYGVHVPEQHRPPHHGAPTDDGVWVTDTKARTCNRVLSTPDLVEALPAIRDDLDANAAGSDSGDFYLFHVKWNPAGDRLMAVLRWVSRDLDADARAMQPKRRPYLATLNPDGTDARLVFDPTDWPGRHGHHPNFCPDGRSVLMNLNTDGQGLRLVIADEHGQRRIVAAGILGSGHPTLHPSGGYILTDTYTYEPAAPGGGLADLRWIDLDQQSERTIARVPSETADPGPARIWRVDPHPAWDRAYQFITFNACPFGPREVFIADLRAVICKS